VLAWAALTLALRRARGAALLAWMHRLASSTAVALGSVWLVQRVSGLA